jgi:hypothetical protein
MSKKFGHSFHPYYTLFMEGGGSMTMSLSGVAIYIRNGKKHVLQISAGN